MLNAWILWWGTYGSPLTEQWWNAPAFYPYPGTLAYSEHLLGLLPIAAPLHWLTGSPIIAYNVTFLLTFVLSGTAAYVLGLELTGRRDAAWIAGLAYAFAPYRFSQIAHLQVLASFWMPLALAALHRYARDRRPRWLVAFAGATLMQGLANGYYLAYFPVLVGLWAVWFGCRAGRWRQVACIGGAGLAATVPLAPILVTYQRLHDEQGLARPLAEIVSFGADLTALAGVTPHLALWGGLEWSPGPEQQLFPGAAIVVLIAAALWRTLTDGVHVWPSPATRAACASPAWRSPCSVRGSSRCGWRSVRGPRSCSGCASRSRASTRLPGTSWSPPSRRCS